VVKIKLKTILIAISVLFVLLTASAGYAATSTSGKVTIDDIKVTVDGHSYNGDFDVVPGSNVKVKVWVKNLYADETEVDLKDVSVAVKIDDIDDGEPIEEESDEEDIDTNKKQVFTINLKIPLEVEDENYDVEITVKGEENKTDFEFTDNSINMDVNKKRHNIRVNRAELTSNNLKCTRTTSFAVNLQNLGTESEENAKFRVYNDELGISKEIQFTLDSDPFDSASKYGTSVPISISPDVATGTYPISLKIDYPDGTENPIELSKDLVIEDCVKPKTTTTTQPDVIITPPRSTSTTIIPPEDIADEEEVVSDESFVSKNLPLILIVGVDVLIIIIAIVFIAAWARKK